MREFFKGWKRKAGCITLGLACLLSVGWERSQGHEDVVVVATKAGIQHQLMSRSSDLVWRSDIWREGLQNPKGVRYPQFSRWSKPIGSSESLRYFLDEGMRSSWWRFQFGVQRGSHLDMYLLKIPYSFLIIPLTLLCTYLLFSKQAVATPKDQP